MALKLTKRTVDALHTDSGRAVVFDTELTGFGLRVMASGAKQFFVQYRMAGGRRAVKRRLTIGRYGSLTLDQARAEARQLLALVAQGKDPAAERARHKSVPTIAELAPAFIDLVRAKRKTSTADEYERQMTRNIIPALGRKKVSDASRSDIGALHLSMRDRPILANRVLALLGAFFHWAEVQDYRPENCNPTRHIERYPEHKRDRYLTADEFIRIGAALVRAEREGLPPAPDRRRKEPSAKTAKHRPKSADKTIPANPFAVAAIRFLLLSGWREGEARTLLWDAVDLDRGLALLSDSKTGRSARPLGVPAVAVLVELPRVAGSAYVFPGAREGRPIVNLTRLWEAVRHAAGVPDVRIHDLRHAFASVAASGGLSLPIIGSLLGHRNASTTQRYAHLSANPLKAAADRTAGEISSLLAGTTVQIIPLRRA